MGIDIYLSWKGQTEWEKKQQICGFSLENGHNGYLREAYHGGPYATRVLAPEAFADDAPAKGVRIPNEVLQKRMDDVKAAVYERSVALYKEMLTQSSPVWKSFVDFVALHREKEEAGLEPRIYASW